MSKIHETYILKRWPCSYYDNATHRWIYGNIYIMAKGVRFAMDNDEKTVDILYSDIVQVRKTMTGLIFRAIVMETRNNEKHWFSSFPDVHSVLQFINFFLKSKLLQKGNLTPPGTTRMEDRTEMGRKLLSVASDSEKTLGNAAEMLMTQGHQLDSAMATMMDLHSDLDVTENLLSGLESWFSGWSIPKEYKTQDPLVVNQSDLSQEIDYEVLYTKLEPHKMNAQQLGVFRVARDGIYLMTDRQKLVHCYKWDGISRVRVVSLWEITVTRFRIGESDISYSLVFTSVYSVLGILDRKLRSKVEYSQDAFRGESSNQKPLNSTSSSSHSKELFQKKNEKAEQILPSVRTSQGSDHLTSNGQSSSSRQQVDQSQQLSLQPSQETVSDKEVAELSSILGDLKSLALGVEQEMAEQDEKIGKLGSTVEEANRRVSTAEKRIKKLL